MEVTQLSPFQEPPNSLGGAPPSGVDRVAASSSWYCSLERLQCLPRLPGFNRIRNEKTRRLFIRICDGDFIVQRELDNIDENVALEVRFGSETEPSYRVSIQMEGANRKSISFESTVIKERVFKGLFRDLSHEEAGMIGLRIVHNYIRASGSRMTRNEIKMVEAILSSKMSGHLYRLEALDFAMCLADVGINRNEPDEHVAYALCEVGRALRAFDRHKDAALVYEEAAEDFCQVEVDEAKTAKLDLVAFSADSFASACIFDRSEEAYIKALNISSRNNVGLDNETVHQVFDSLLGLYLKWWKTGEMERQAAQQVTEVLSICATLRAISGFGIMQDFVSVLVHPNSLQAEFRTEQQAILALDRARQSSSSQSFREAILSCQNPSISASQARGNASAKKTDGTSDTDRDTCVNTARQGGGATGESVCCSNPSCGLTEEDSGRDLMECLCHRAYYCDRSCQKAHWQEHKRTCGYYLNKKKSKN